METSDKIKWIDTLAEKLVKKYFFHNEDDVLGTLRDILIDPDHPENYWTSNIQDGGKIKCHYCVKRYTNIQSVKTHEQNVHNHKPPKVKGQSKSEGDNLHNYIMMVFKLIALHKNLDTAVDMADGHRFVRSAKYELPIYNKTNKIKYVIGSIYLTALTSEIISHEQQESLRANRFINFQSGKTITWV